MPDTILLQLLLKFLSEQVLAFLSSPFWVSLYVPHFLHIPSSLLILQKHLQAACNPWFIVWKTEDYPAGDGVLIA